MSSPSSHPLFTLQECSDCGLWNVLPEPIVGRDMCCARCGYALRQVKDDSLMQGLLWTVAAFFFYILAVLSPMLQVGIYGHDRSGQFDTGPLALDTEGYWILSALIFLTTMIMPFLKIVATFVVLMAVRLAYRPPWIASLYAFVKHLKAWVMVEVYLLGFLVAYSRLQVMATVHVTIAVVGLVGLMLSLLAMDTQMDPEEIWGKIRRRQPFPKGAAYGYIGCDTCYQVTIVATRLDQPCVRGDCPRCGEALRHRKPNSMNRAWACTLAAAILYIPSNIYPVMNVTKLGKTKAYTIFAGLQELAHVGLFPLAALVFMASIAIPVFKLVMLSYMLWETKRGSSKHLHSRTRLYRLLDLIGRWSMVDIFVVSILVALVRFDWFAQITAGTGAIYFASVVVLTLLAVKSFDPRLMWDITTHQPSTCLTTPPSPSRLAA